MPGPYAAATPGATRPARQSSSFIGLRSSSESDSNASLGHIRHLAEVDHHVAEHEQVRVTQEPVEFLPVVVVVVLEMDHLHAGKEIAQGLENRHLATFRVDLEDVDRGDRVLLEPLAHRSERDRVRSPLSCSRSWQPTTSRCRKCRDRAGPPSWRSAARSCGRGRWAGRPCSPSGDGRAGCAGSKAKIVRVRVREREEDGRSTHVRADVHHHADVTDERDRAIRSAAEDRLARHPRKTVVEALELQGLTGPLELQLRGRDFPLLLIGAGTGLGQPRTRSRTYRASRR